MMSSVSKLVVKAACIHMLRIKNQQKIMNTFKFSKE